MVNNQFSKDIQLDKLFGALADSHRRTILANLTKGPMTATQIANQLPISAPATSQSFGAIRSRNSYRRGQNTSLQNQH
jgi:DNA-binding transcriptional ArsR family regulator